MRWKIAEFTFCDQQQTLTSSDITQQLEPMMVELLSYFCQNKDQILSKDQLVEQVWLGRVVSDNAVSKLITKLRKALNDDARKPRFIATFPKKGYKFIADVELVVEPVVETIVDKKIAQQHDGAGSVYQQPQNNQQVANSKNLSTNRHLKLLSFSMLFVITLLAFVLYDNEKAVSPVLTHAKAITSAAGNELFPAVSPDGKLVSYMSARSDRMHLMIKNIVNQQAIEINHEEGVGVGPATWSFDGKLIAYLVATPQRCQYFVRSIDNFTLGEARLIHNCPAGSYGKIAFTHDNNRLVYAESEGGSSPYELFEINLQTKLKKKLKQPEVFLGGNSQFDVHPVENKILISSPDKQQWEGFYSLDLDTDQLTLLFKQDSYICCGIWSHDGERVVLMGEHPAYQLISYDLSGSDMKIIYSGSRKISWPIRHTNGQDYLFTSGQGNSNVHIFDMSTKEQRIIAEASADDRLAVFFHKHAATAQQVAYVSLSTGNEEIWLAELASGSRKKLSNFNDSRHYVDLKWSPNNKHLMALTLNEIHIINVDTGTFEALKIPQTEIRAVSFKSNNILAYSRKQHDKWQVSYYHLDNHHVESVNTKWQYVQFSAELDDTLWLDQSAQLYAGINQQLVEEPLLLEVSFLSGRAFNLKKSSVNWFWYDVENNNAIVTYSPVNKTVKTVLASNVYHFDIAGNLILFGQASSANTDIYQTQSLAY